MPSPTPGDHPLLTVGQVAEQAGLNTSHIRYYERIGVLPEPERVAGQRRYRDEVLHRLSIIDVAQRAGLSLEEIAPLTGPDSRTADTSRHIRRIADEKLPAIDALIARAQAVKQWLQVAQGCDCESVDVCGLFVDPTLLPPAGGDVDRRAQSLSWRGGQGVSPNEQKTQQSPSAGLRRSPQAPQT